MNKNYLYKWVFPKKISGWLASLLVLTVTAQGVAQITCNLSDKTPLVNGTAAGFSVSLSPTASSSGLGSWTPLFGTNTSPKAIDSDLGDPAVGQITGTGSVTLTVKSATTFAAGHYAGFRVKPSTIVGGTTLRIRTLLDNAEQEVSTSGSFLLDLSTPYDAGFVTTKAFDAIEIRYSLVGVAGSIDVYHPVVQRFCAGPDLALPEHCNTPVALSLPQFPVMTEVSSTLLAGVTNANNAINGSVNPATLNVTLGAAELAVKNVLDEYEFTDGAFVGFDIEHANLVNLGLLSGLTITLYLNDTQVDQSNSGNLLSVGLLSTGRQKIGIVTTAKFNKIKISNASALSLNGGLKIHNAIIHPYCEGATLACNTSFANVATPLTAPSFPLITEVGSTLLAGVSEPNNAIYSGGYATMNVTLGAAELAVKNVLDEYEFTNGAFVGFDIEQADLVNVGLISGLRISVWLDGTEVDASTGANLVSASLLSTGRQKIGIVTTKKFNKIKISNAAVLSLSSGILIHNAFIQPFCEGTALACNTPTAMTAPEYPVFINYKNTGSDGLLNALSGFTGLENVLNASSTEPAELFQAVEVLDPLSFSVKKGGTSYLGGEYVGYEVASEALLDVALFAGVSITTYLNGIEVDSYGTGGIAVSASLVQSDGRQRIGVVTKSGKPFDEVKISFRNLAGVSLGTVQIFRFISERFCSVDLACNTQYAISRNGLPAVIEGTRTGFSTVACVDCEIENPAALTSSSELDFATIQVPVTVDLGASASISVRTPATVYPKGTMAGFRIKSYGSLVDVELFPSITISTYLNGTPVESRSGTNLIDLTALLRVLGPGPGIFNVGFMTTAPFDEIQIRVGSLVSASVLNKIDVYHAFVNTMTSIGADGTLSCVTTNPDMNIAYINEEVEGDVSTNDYNGSEETVTYGSPVAASGNPTTTLPSLNPDGSYTFETSTVGIYRFTIPVCVGSNTGDACMVEQLVITVLDPTKTNNPPVVNNDVIAVNGADTSPTMTPVSVKSNDGPGNIGGSLSDPTVLGTPAPMGTATPNGQKINYTPAANFYGMDTLAYSVTETPSNQSGSASVFVRVLPTGSSYVSASDDYNRTPSGVTLTIGSSNGVLLNDNDSKGGTLTASSPNASARIAATNDAGEVTFSSDGGYVYTPPSGFQGTGAFPYQVCNADGVCTNATLYISVFDDSALPVKLASFTVTAEGSVSNLSWSTSEEVNTSHFEVERSAEGKNWAKIGSVAASVNSTTLSRYSFADPTPLVGVNYYRLRMVDKDGTFANSEIRSVKFERLAGVRLYPNPVVDQFKIASDVAIKEVTLYSVTGKALIKSGRKTEFDLSHLPTGIYTLSITHTNGQVTSHKILKK
jgi:hypothetical protein